MNSKYLWIIILTAFVIVGLYHVFAVGRFNYPEFRLKSGQVSETELIAPFDFPILKSAIDLNNEREQSIEAIPTPYRINDEALFNALSSLDQLWSIFYNKPEQSPVQKAAEATQAGFNLSAEDLVFAYGTEALNQSYEKLRDGLQHIYERGIYATIETDSISIYNNDEAVVNPKTYYFQLEEAQAELIERVPETGKLITALSDVFILPNLEIDDNLLSEFRQRRISEIPETEGVVLQNEVIIRKNARVTEGDIEKLESLQAAFRNRNMQKSPLQQMLLAFGLLIYTFLILLIANHYYGVYNMESQQHVADFLPVNLGFILIVLFGIFTNHIFTMNNLLIPFALTVIAAAILVGTDFGMLYGICSMLLLNPFINWETYTPIIFLLSTSMTLLLVKRQRAQHEFLSIWFYLLISTTLVNVAISIYKSDPIAVVFRNIGFGMISSAISIIGILIIVPYYERRWNRATKQTLLELLDFNHPLLKQLATTAVGTYHHSLIVGNLAERAAEAIGANPLLARVGSYYHDIGKIVNTEAFTENNENSNQIHDTRAPEDSAKIIKNHVVEGITLARKYKIPQPVIDILMQHHGNSLIRYFYDKAEKLNLDAPMQAFQYSGPKPQSKEAVLVMVADVVESTTKAKNIQSEEAIIKIIDDTIARLIREGQFDEAPITMKDLNMIKQSMLPVLGSIYRKRLDYPEEHDKR
ncbi:MAG: HDIG domain-containing protein [Candidatus Cloacimonetes bacterium]|nr:HDIG domain-containing protein [Candidatus Cloacimonadota bacterium]MDD4667575.1 HDIG domain-containing protein [Candidatus Cloacimonadota bacterium]